MSRLSSKHFVTIFAVAAAAALAACSKKAENPEPMAEAAPANVPAPEVASPPVEKNVREFTIGKWSAMALRDGGIEVPNDNKTLAVGHTPDEVGDLVSKEGLPKDKLSLSIQPLLVKTDDRVLLFDTGAAGAFGPTTGKLPESLAEAGVDPATVTDIFISHVHGDHVMGLVKPDGTLAFANATIHISKPEWAFLSSVKQEMASKMGLATRDALVAAMKPKVQEFKPGADLIPGVVKAVEIKGHTPGHSGYLIGTGVDSILYIGDMAHHYVVSVQKPDWTIAFDADAKTAEASRAKIIAESAASGQRIFAVHFPFPGIGKFEKKEDHYVWVAE